MTMAADENIHNSCIFDPNFAVICSFFEKFSSLCGIKKHTFTELQQMIDSVEEISPQLVDLHVRLMRKARKNVNPDRWQRTLAKFCYFYLPDDCWALEQKGYKCLNYSQRLRILLTLIGAQFDHNVKFKADVNKITVNDLRLTPFGKDKDGNNYWLHTDEDLNLKIYKEDSEEEKWELIVQNRDDLKKLIDELMKERDPNRKLDEIEEEEEEEEVEPEEDAELENVTELKEAVESEKDVALEKVGNEKAKNNKSETGKDARSILTSSEPNHIASNQIKLLAQNDAKISKKPFLKNESIVSNLKESVPSKSSLDFLLKPKPADTVLPIKPLDKESFELHLKTLDSHNLLRPLLDDDDPSVSPLKTKINQKINAIKPVVSKLESKTKDLLLSKSTKPGLKLEQILKSKLAQKLAANSSPVSENRSSSCSDPAAGLPNSPRCDSSSLPHKEDEPSDHNSTPSSEIVTPLKRAQSCDEADCESKKVKIQDADDEREIEEPVMLVTGVGSGQACDTGNETETEKNETSNTNQLSHKVDNILKKNDDENSESASTSDETVHNFSATKVETDSTAEKKKPKLWTIDAICSTDSKETKNRSDDVSLFPNYSFNRENKKASENSLFRGCSGSGESYSIFNLAADSKDDHAMSSIPTNFYFGCNNQNPCFLPMERNMNNYKPANKTHNVKDIVDHLDTKQITGDTAAKVSKFDVESLCADATAIVTSAKIESKPEKVADSVGNYVTCTENSVSKDHISIAESELVDNVSCHRADAKSAENETVIDETENSNVDDTSNESPVQTEAEDLSANVTRTKIRAVEVPHTEAVNEEVRAKTDGDVANVERSAVKSPEQLKSIVEPPPLVNVDDQVQTPSDETNVAAVADAAQNQLQASAETESPSGESRSDEVCPVSHRAEAQTLATVPVHVTKIDVIATVEPASNSVEAAITSEVNTSDASEINTCDQSDTGIFSALETGPPNVSDDDASDATLINDSRAPDVGTSITPDTVASSASANVISCSASDGGPFSASDSATLINSNVNHSNIRDVGATDDMRDADPSSPTDILVSSKSETGTPDLPSIDSSSASTVDASNTTETTTISVHNSSTSIASESDISAKPVDDVSSLQDPIIPRAKPVAETETEVGCTGRKPETEEKGAVTKSEESAAIISECHSVPSPAEQRSNCDISIDEVNESEPLVPEVQPLDVQETAGSESSKIAESKPVESLEDAALEMVADAKVESKDDEHSTSAIVPDTQKSADNVETPAALVRTSSRLTRSTRSKQPIRSSFDDTGEVKPSKRAKVAKTSPKDEEGSGTTPTPTRGGYRKGKQKPETEAVKLKTRIVLKADSVEHEEPVETKPTKRGKGKKVSVGDGPETNVTKKKGKKSVTDDAKSNGGDANDSVEASQPKRKAKKSDVVEPKATSNRKNQQPSADEDGSENVDAVKIKFTKRGKNKVSPTVEPNKRGGRKSQAAVAAGNEEIAKEKGAKKGRGKNLKVKKRGPKKIQPTVDDDDDGSLSAQIKQTTTVKKKGGKAKKLSKEKVEEAASGDEKESECEMKSAAGEVIDVQVDAVAAEEEKINDKESKSETKAGTKKRVTKRGWLNEVDVKNIEPSNNGSVGIRQSRRIAQLKIKEQAEVKYVEPTTPKKSATNQKSKNASATKKNSKTPNKKSKAKLTRDESEDEVYEKSNSSSKKKRKKKDKKNFDVSTAWKGSSDSSSEEEDVEDEDHFEEDEEELAVNDASDHEFSPESDIDEDDDDYTPVKRARTAHSKPSAEDKIERDDLNCQSCNKADQPEWILLCDVCDEGWHASCLKPPLLSIPEGEWFCPPCQHNQLITNLQKFLIAHDKNMKKKANEELRKKRLEYVGISFSNIVLDSQSMRSVGSKASRAESERSATTNQSSADESSEEEDEPLYQLRVRRQANVSHRLSEYDELMNSAIQREDIVGIIPINVDQDVNVVPKLQNGENLVEKKTAEIDENEETNETEEQNTDENAPKDGKVSPVVLSLRNIRKKPPRLTKLDVSSEDDHYSDEDFKGSSAEEHDDDEEYGKSETDSDEAQYRRGGRGGPVRRSTRARVTRYDNDFINDDDSEEYEEDDEYDRKSKKKRKRYSESDSEEDSTWGKRKKNKYSKSFKPAQKKRRRITFEGDSDEETSKKIKKSRVKYGLDESDDDDDDDENQPQRRTRGKKINYLENLGSDSEEDEEISRKPRKILSDDDDYVNEEENEVDENEQNSSKETSKSENGEEAEPISEACLTPENRVEAVVPNKESSENDVTKIVSPIKCSLEPSPSPFPETLKELNESGSLKTYSRSIDVQTKLPDPNEVGITQPVLKDDSKLSNNLAPSTENQAFNNVTQDEPKPVPPNVDANSSLKGMQSLAQSISQTNSSPTTIYTMPAIQDPKYPGMMPLPPGPVSVNFADVGIRYEESDADKLYPQPLRVVSPSKLYGMQEEQRGGHPRPPFPAPARMPPPILASPRTPMMIPHSMPTAMPLRAPRPLSVPPMTAPPPLRHMNAPPPNVSVTPNTAVAPNTATPTTEPTSKRGRRGRGKKQLEQERLEREAMEAAANRGSEMIPLHLLKGQQPPDMNMTRPPPAPFSAASTPQFLHYTNVQRMPFSQAPSPVPTSSVATVTMGNTSKRVKITPTRMRMTSPQNQTRFPRATGPSAMYRPHPPDVPPPSSTATALANDSKMPSSTVVTTSPAKSEPIPTSTAPLKRDQRDQADQYYLPTPYPPSQIPRGYNQRPEFTLVRNPNVYRQSPPVSTAPPPVTTSYNRMPHPYPNSSAIIARPPTATSTQLPLPPPQSVYTSPSTKPMETSNASVHTPVPVSYSSPYTPPKLSSTPPSTKTTPTHSPHQVTPPGPPSTSPYQMLPMKQLPPVMSTAATTMQSSPSTMLPYPPPPATYFTSPMVPSYAQPQQQSTQLPPVSTFAPTGPTPPQSAQAVRNRLGPPPPVSSIPPYKPPTSLSGDPPTSSHSQAEYVPVSTSQTGDEFQYAESSALPPPAASVQSTNESENRNDYEPTVYGQSSTTYEEQEQGSQQHRQQEQEEQQQQTTPPEETSSGEFGGLVSYFSSQREEDLDT